MRGRFACAVPTAEIPDHERTALGQDLICVPVGSFHRIEHGIDKWSGHFFMKEVTHRVDEDAPWLSPTQRLSQPLSTQFQVKTIFERMTGDTSKALGEAFGVAKIAAAADLRATRNRIPRCVSPFDWCR